MSEQHEGYGRPVGGGDKREGSDPPPRRCDLCGGALLERNCKVVCLNCGYQRDCSDP